MGVAPAERIDDAVAQLRPIKDGEPILNATDKNTIFKVFDPVVREDHRKLYNTGDYMKDAKNVIVIGMSYPEAAATRAGREPAESVGPFIFSQSMVQTELAFVGIEVVKELKRNGYKALITRDLIGMGSLIGSPRGLYVSPFDGAIEAVAAGLGELTYSGTLKTEKYGINQRVICIVTDAPLEADSVKANNIQKTCADCKKCITACPMNALKADEMASLVIDGKKFDYIPLDTNACQWASRYVLTNRDGCDRLGATLDIMPKGKITAEQLEEGLRQRDPIIKGRPGNAEQCIIECPLIYR